MTLGVASLEFRLYFERIPHDAVHQQSILWRDFEDRRRTLVHYQYGIMQFVSSVYLCSRRTKMVIRRIP